MTSPFLTQNSIPISYIHKNVAQSYMYATHSTRSSISPWTFPYIYTEHGSFIPDSHLQWTKSVSTGLSTLTRYKQVCGQSFKSHESLSSARHQPHIRSPTKPWSSPVNVLVERTYVVTYHSGVLVLAEHPGRVVVVGLGGVKGLLMGIRGGRRGGHPVLAASGCWDLGGQAWA